MERDDEDVWVEAFLLHVTVEQGSAARTAAKTILDEFLAGRRGGLSTLGPSDVDAHLKTSLWKGATDDERLFAQECLEGLVRYLVKVGAAGAHEARAVAATGAKTTRTHPTRPTRTSSDAADTRETPDTPDPSKERRSEDADDRPPWVWIGPLRSVWEASALCLRDPGSVFLASGVGLIVLHLLPMIGVGPVGTGLATFFGRLDRRGSATLGDLGEGAASYALSGLLVTLLHLAAVAASGGLGVLAIWALLALRDGVGPDLLEAELVAWSLFALILVTASLVVWVSNLFFFVHPLLALRQMGPLRAIATSRRFARRHWMQLLAVELCSGLVAAVLSVVPVLGWIAAAGLWHSVTYVVFRRVFDPPGS